MKKTILTSIILATSLMHASVVLAQDDDIYYTRQNSRRAVYASTANDVWETKANDDWNVDAYNRRGNSAQSSQTASGAAAGSYTYNATTGQIEYTAGNATAQNGNASGQVNNNSGRQVEYIHDTIYIVESYRYSSRIRRFHNPMFGFYAYSPWYDVAYYDPFFWDYSYYDPWWYISPSFGFHWSSWNWGWNYGYYNSWYSGWYGGWYAPYYTRRAHWYAPDYSRRGAPIHHGRNTFRNDRGSNFHGRGNTPITGTPSNRRFQNGRNDGGYNRSGGQIGSNATRNGSSQSGSVGRFGGRTPSNAGTGNRSYAPSRSNSGSSNATRSNSNSTPSRSSSSSNSGNRSSSNYNSNTSTRSSGSYSGGGYSGGSRSSGGSSSGGARGGSRGGGGGGGRR